MIHPLLPLTIYGVIWYQGMCAFLFLIGGPLKDTVTSTSELSIEAGK